MSDKDAIADYKAAKAKAMTLRPWYKKKRIWFLVIVVLAIIGSSASKHVSPAFPSASQSSLATTSNQSSTAISTDQSAVSSETVSQSNARQKAADYLNTSSFSRKGLIDQLGFEGFSPSDSAYGVDAQHADWKSEAGNKAADYLKTSSFSHSGLVTQLEFEGFTPSQAEFGVASTGL